MSGKSKNNPGAAAGKPPASLPPSKVVPGPKPEPKKERFSQNLRYVFLPQEKSEMAMELATTVKAKAIKEDESPRACGCSVERRCALHDPRWKAFRAALLRGIPTGKGSRTTIAKIAFALYPEDDYQRRGLPALDIEIRDQIKILKAEGHPVCTTRAGIWLATNTDDMKDSFLQRIRQGASLIAQVRKEAGSNMFNELAGQLKLSGDYKWLKADAENGA